jgi:ATP-dependent helicase/nuclease subunit B
MTEIVKTKSNPPDSHLHAAAWQTLWAQVGAHMQRLQAHPARTVVLLPFFQLQAVARVSSRQVWPSGFTPRLETTKSWSQRISHFVPGELDISFDAGQDSLRASTWLQRAGLGGKQGMLASVLVDTAHQLGAVVAAVPPAQRPAWAAQARVQVLQGLEANPLVYEAAVARIALEWAVASSYASDALFEPTVRADLDALVVVQGLQANPLAQALTAHWQVISSTAQWQPEPADNADRGDANASRIAVHAADNAHDEADRAAACVLRHLGLGRSPVALAAVDRVSARRISATLHLHGVALADETGWKLSTTRAAAGVMALLRAARWQASGEGADDALLDWLKHTNAPTAQVDALERTFRKQNTTPAQQNIAQAAIEFIVNAQSDATGQADSNPSNRTSVDAVLASLRRSRPIAQWLPSLQQALRTTGQWGALVADAAGRDCVQALHLLQPEALEGYAHNLSLAEFSAWATDCLESASFKPSTDDGASAAQVVVLPLAQVMARPFAAIVIAGADEQRLPAAPEPQGAWTSAQRAALGLPSREALGAEQLAVWQCAMQVPQVDVLWRAAEGEQALQPSPLLQRWQLGQTAQGHSAAQAADPREQVQLAAQPTQRPLPTAQGMQVSRLSASSYSDLRTCPYRFFALRLLGLHEAPELDAEVDKRDFGSWLHAVLSDFHTRRKGAAEGMAQGTLLAASDIDLIDQCAADQQMADSGFVPFAAAWPQVRSSYLAWLAQHEAEGWQFDEAELERTLEHAGVTLNGRLDRVDRLSRGPEAGTAYVLDYKTESSAVSKDRVKNPMEDTQLAFYAALLGEDDIHAAYVNVAERDCKITPQPEIMAARDAVLSGITQDVQRIHAGHAMPALGEGKACDFCAARGLCRKDFWAV